jgi:hypothetical protein
VTVDALSRLAAESVVVSALTRPTVGVIGRVRTGMLRVDAVTVRVSALTCHREEIKKDENVRYRYISGSYYSVVPGSKSPVWSVPTVPVQTAGRVVDPSLHFPHDLDLDPGSGGDIFR